MKLEEGIYRQVNTKDYFSVTHATNENGVKYKIPSKSLLSRFHDNPEAWLTEPDFEPTPNMVMGSLLDCLLLTPHLFKQEFFLLEDNPPRKPSAVQRNAKKKSQSSLDAIKFWDNVDLQSRNKAVITRKNLKDAEAAVTKIYEDDRCKDVMINSTTQTAMVFKYKGYFVKAMIDIEPNEDSEYGDSLIDLKRTSGFIPREFAGVVRKYAYHCQAALYLHAYNQVTGQNRTRWHFMVSQDKAPFSCGLVELSRADIAKGKQEVFKWLDEYIACVETNQWLNPYQKERVILNAFTY